MRLRWDTHGEDHQAVVVTRVADIVKAMGECRLSRQPLQKRVALSASISVAKQSAELLGGSVLHRSTPDAKRGQRTHSHLQERSG
jgi:hypothetical protein